MRCVGKGGVRLAGVLCAAFCFTQLAVADPPMLGLSGNLSFTYQIGGPIPSPGTLIVTNVAHGDMAWVATIQNAPWASVSPSSGSLPDTFDRGISSPPSTVTVNPSGLAIGSYTGTITVTATSSYGVPNSPQTIPITLVVAPANNPILSVNPISLSFFATQSIQDGGSSTISIANAGAGTLSWSAAVSPAASWLSITPGPASIGVRAAGQQLTPGSYSTSIVISAPGAQPPSVSIPVTLNVQAASPPSFVVDTTPLAFQSVAGGPSPAAQNVSINNAGQMALNWQVTPSTSNGGGWLKVSPSSGTNTGFVSIRPDSTGLSAGTYVGRVTMTAAGATNSATIPVTLTVMRPASIQPSTTRLSFSSVLGLNPASQVVTILNGGDAPLSWSAAATTSNGKPWLKISPASGGANGQIGVSVDTTGLVVGTYAGQITLTCNGGCAGSTIPVTLAVLPPPSTILSLGVVSAARLTPGPVSAGSVVTVYGTRLGPDPGVTGQADSQGNLPTSVAGTTILADGVPAPLFYVSSTQINFQIPYEVAGKAKTHLIIQPGSAQASELDVTLVPASFGLFTTDGKQAIVVNQDYTYNTFSTPITAGNVVVLYGTGQGMLNPPAATGAPGPVIAPFPVPTIPITMAVNGEPANVLFAGLAPEMVGVVQVNVQIPDDIPSGPATLTFQQGDSPGGQSVLVYVKSKAASPNATATK